MSDYAIASPWEIGFHFGLGLVGAVAAVAFVLGVRLFARLFRKLAIVPEAVLPIVGLALLAGLGFFWPEVLETATRPSLPHCGKEFRGSSWLFSPG